MHIHGATLCRDHSHSSWFICAYKLVDERNIPPLGRIGDPDDIIASVRVQEGKVSFTAIDADWVWG